jgi:hypothetical protein
LCQSLRFLDPSFGRTPRCLARELGNGNHRPFAASNVGFAMTVIFVQDAAPSSSASGSPPKLNGFAG